MMWNKVTQNGGRKEKRVGNGKNDDLCIQHIFTLFNECLRYMFQNDCCEEDLQKPFTLRKGT